MLTDQVNTTKAIAKAEMILKTKKTTGVKTKSLAAGVVVLMKERLPNTLDTNWFVITKVKCQN